MTKSRFTTQHAIAFPQIREILSKFLLQLPMKDRSKKRKQK